jgi:hypothetical protein
LELRDARLGLSFALIKKLDQLITSNLDEPLQGGEKKIKSNNTKISIKLNSGAVNISRWITKPFSRPREMSVISEQKEYVESRKNSAAMGSEEGKAVDSKESGRNIWEEFADVVEDKSREIGNEEIIIEDKSREMGNEEIIIEDKSREMENEEIIIEDQGLEIGNGEGMTEDECLEMMNGEGITEERKLEGRRKEMRKEADILL